jgi:hypothetical protein
MNQLTAALIVVIGILGGFYVGAKYGQVHPTAAASPTPSANAAGGKNGAGKNGGGGGGAGAGAATLGPITAVHAEPGSDHRRADRHRRRGDRHHDRDRQRRRRARRQAGRRSISQPRFEHRHVACRSGVGRPAGVSSCSTTAPWRPRCR